jgi:hypothetical protein
MDTDEARMVKRVMSLQWALIDHWAGASLSKKLAAQYPQCTSIRSPHPHVMMIFCTTPPASTVSIFFSPCSRFGAGEDAVARAGTGESIAPRSKLGS